MNALSEARKAEWADPLIRVRRCEALSVAARRRYSDPKERALASERAKAQVARRSPDQIAANAARLRKIRAEQPQSAQGKSKLPEYAVWAAMIQRCINPNIKQFKDYGGRGIRVCDEWVGRGGYLRFLQHVGLRPSDRHTIGRINNDGNYEPGNVRWETYHEQLSNFRRNRRVTIRGETRHLAEWARRIGISAPALAGRIDRGWSDEDLLSPSRKVA